MQVVENYWVALLGSALILIGVRVLPVIFAQKIKFPKFLIVWLEFLPITLLGSFIALQFIEISGVEQQTTSPDRMEMRMKAIFSFFFAGGLTLWVTHLTDKLFLGISVGIVAYQLAMWL